MFFECWGLLADICRVGYGVSYWTTPDGHNKGWRLSIALQFVPAVLFMAGLPFCHET
jgi:hypothetical protein